jgi:hypothetical protein
MGTEAESITTDTGSGLNSVLETLGSKSSKRKKNKRAADKDGKSTDAGGNAAS